MSARLLLIFGIGALLLALPTPGDPAPPEADTGAPVPVDVPDMDSLVTAAMERVTSATPEATIPDVVLPDTTETEAPEASGEIVYDGRATGRFHSDRLGGRFQASGIPHLDSMRTYVGVRETRHNRGPEIDTWIRNAGLKGAQPYCAAAVKYACDTAGAQVLNARGQDVSTALARTFTHSAEFIPAREVRIGREVVLPGDAPVWGYRRSRSGHIGLASHDDRLVDPERFPYERPDGSCYVTVEANTSCSGSGSAREGDGVCLQTRCGQTLGGMVLLGYTRPTYPDDR